MKKKKKNRSKHKKPNDNNYNEIQNLINLRYQNKQLVRNKKPKTSTPPKETNAIKKETTPTSLERKSTIHIYIMK